MDAALGDRDAVEGAIELAVAAAVEADLPEDATVLCSVTGPGGDERGAPGHPVGSDRTFHQLMYPDDFAGALVVAGTHRVLWAALSAERLESRELAIEEFRFP